jgi:hypothetical protein
VSADADRGQHEAELTDLTEARRDLSRAPRKAPEPGQEIDGQNLARDQENKQENQPAQPLYQRAGVDQGSDRHEEEDREDVAKREQSLARFRRFAALADGEAGNERGEGEGDAEKARAKAGQREGARDRDDEKEIVFLAEFAEATAGGARWRSRR